MRPNLETWKTRQMGGERREEEEQVGVDWGVKTINFPQLNPYIDG